MLRSQDNDLGVATWYDFAEEVQSLGLELGLLKSEIPIIPIKSHEYPLAASRPAFSLLDASSAQGIKLGVSWRKNLRVMRSLYSQSPEIEWRGE